MVSDSGSKYLRKFGLIVDFRIRIAISSKNVKSYIFFLEIRDSLNHVKRDMTNGYARMQQQAGAAGGKGGAISCPGMIIRFFFTFFSFFL